MKTRTALAAAVLALILALPAAAASRWERTEAHVAVFSAEFPHVKVLHSSLIDPDNAGKILRQLAVHLREFPQVAVRLKSVDLNAQGWPQDTRAAALEDWDGKFMLAFHIRHFRGDNPQADDIASHESGHLVDFNLSDTHQALVKGWKRDHPTNRSPTEYGRSNHAENWAESFKHIYHRVRKSWHSYSRDLDALLAPHRTKPAP